MQRIDALGFAIAGAIYGAAVMALVTVSALMGIPGFRPVASRRGARQLSASCDVSRV